MRFRCGFEAGGIGFYDNLMNNTGTANIITSTAGLVHKTAGGQGGTYALQTVSGSWGFYSPNIGTGDRWLNCWARHTGPSNAIRFVFYRDGVAQCYVQQNTTGQVTLYRGGGALLATSAGNVPNPNVGHWWNIYAKCMEAPNGVLSVFIDTPGITPATVPFLTYTGDVREASSDEWDQFAFVTVSTPLSGILDDVVTTSEVEGALDESYILGSVPASDVSVTFTRSAGLDSWANVDTRPAALTPNNYATALGQEDVYGVTSIPAGTVLGVSVWIYAARDGVISQVRTGLTLAGSTVYGAYVALPASPSVQAAYVQTLDMAPTGALWTSSDFDTLQVRVQFN